MSREKLTDQRISLTLVLKANIHNTDNRQSQMLLELRSNQQNAIVIGMYYADRTMYFNVLGKEYYAEELNLTNTLGQVGPLLANSGINIANIVPGIVSGSTGIEMLDGFLGLLLAFFEDKVEVTKYNMVEDSNPKNPEFRNIDYLFTLNAGDILGLATGIVSWDTFRFKL